MGKTRQPPSEAEQGVTGRQIAAIAALLLTAPKPGELAAALLALLPAGLLARFPSLGAQAALTAARLVLSTVDVPEPANRRSRERTATTGETLGIVAGGDSRGEAVFSALYGVNAARRLFRGREDFAAALDQERGYLALHRQAKERRVKAQRVADAMVDLYETTVFGWLHGDPKEPRLNHVAASGKNLDLSKPIPISTGALPGALPHCTCSLVPAFSNATLLD